MYLIWVESLDLFKASALLCTESQPIDYSNYKTRLVSNSKSLLSLSMVRNTSLGGNEFHKVALFSLTTLS